MWRERGVNGGNGEKEGKEEGGRGCGGYGEKERKKEGGEYVEGMERKIEKR